jgi:alpha-D-xyloside xylohydrolase
VIPHAAVAQSTNDIDWTHLELRAFGRDSSATGLVALPGGPAHELRVVGTRLEADPLPGRVIWRVSRVPVSR